VTEMREDPRFPGALIHISSYVDEGAIIGKGTKIWHFCHVLSGTVIGENCSIGQNVMIGPRVRVGNGCKIQNNVSLYDGVELADDVFCGPSCVFTNVNNPRANVSRRDEFRTTPIGQGASIGANATIVCGHRLGEYCFIGAGSVVTKDVPAFALMVGNPAHRMGWVSRQGEKLSTDFVCQRSGERYREISSSQLALIE
jgi:UDP-2-acetamido-3-amino-2,3-dideoxy-glucuronate N-acetyltransferase